MCVGGWVGGLRERAKERVVSVCMCACARARVCVCMCVRTCVCVCACITFTRLFFPVTAMNTIICETALLILTCSSRRMPFKYIFKQKDEKARTMHYCFDYSKHGGFGVNDRIRSSGFRTCFLSKKTNKNQQASACSDLSVFLPICL